MSAQIGPGARSLAIQTVIYANPPHEIERAAEAVISSVARAAGEGFVSSWHYVLGDCSAEPALDQAVLDVISRRIADAGGEFRYKFFGENLGHGGGHNRLSAYSMTDLILILNPDAKLAPDTVALLALAVAGNVGVADARQVPLEHPKDYDPVTGDTSWCSGACSLTLRAAFEAVGGFDSETFFLYCDDVDYSWRVRLAGWRTVYAPAAAVFHDKRLALGGGWLPSAAEKYYSAEAALLLAYKYFHGARARFLSWRFSRGSDDDFRRAAAEFKKRRAEGRLPLRLDPRHRFSHFTKGSYARHRY